MMHDLNLFMASSSPKPDQFHKATSSETHSQTSTFIKSIPCGPSLSHIMTDNNDSHHSNTSVIDSVLSEAQMQMLQSMMTQARNESCAEEQIKAANSNYAEDLSRWSEVNLSHQPEQEPHYPDQ